MLPIMLAENTSFPEGYSWQLFFCVEGCPPFMYQIWRTQRLRRRSL